MDKIPVSPNIFIPMHVVLVGTQVTGKANFMTVGWCSRANANPPMISCGINKVHFTRGYQGKQNILGQYPLIVSAGKDRLLRTCFGCKHRQVQSI